MKNKLIVAVLCSFSVVSFAQSKEAGSDRAAIKQYMVRKNTTPAFPADKDVEAVKNVLKKYNKALTDRDVTGTEILFTNNSNIYESGSSEGNYQQYLAHHLSPELKEFKSFIFSNYKIDVQVEGKYAFATETYTYTIVSAKDNTEVTRMGVATSILQKVKDEWKIFISHNSSRK